MRETRTAQTSIFDIYAKHERGVFLQNLSELLNDLPELLGLIEGDLCSDKTKATGRKGLSAESVFRIVLLKQITQASYDELSFLLADSPSYRAFARLDSKCFPSKSTLCVNVRRLQPETLQCVSERLSWILHNQGVMDFTTMRMDSTVVETNIAEPSDSRLLDDGIRVLSRLFSKSQARTGVKIRLTDYRAASRKLAAAIFYGKKVEKDRLYEEFIVLAHKVIKQCHKATEQVKAGSNHTASHAWIEEVDHYRALLERVIDQTQRRVFQGECVPASEKLVSLFEPHTDIIVKAHRGTEYGHKINLSTDLHGFITALSIEKGNPKDSKLYLPFLKAHQVQYRQLPETTIADGGYAELENVEQAKALGIKRVAFHKKNGISLSVMGIKEKTLKKLRDFRAGIEGNISELKRAFGASRATWKGEKGFKSFVWASVISYNLVRWARFESG